MKTIYTTAGSQELLKFQEQQKLLLEQMIAEKKFVFGDDVLEITASDIKETSESIQPIRRSKKSFSNSILLSKIYISLGVTLILVALSYNYIHRLIAESPQQRLLFFMGIVLLFSGIVANWYIRSRFRRIAMIDYIEKHRVQKINSDHNDL